MFDSLLLDNWKRVVDENMQLKVEMCKYKKAYKLMFDLYSQIVFEIHNIRLHSSSDEHMIDRLDKFDKDVQQYQIVNKKIKHEDYVHFYIQTYMKYFF